MNTPNYHSRPRPLCSVVTLSSLRSVLGFTSQCYKGLSSVLVGSFPSAAVFFWTYEACKNNTFANELFVGAAPVKHMAAASVAEVMACCVRVPFELIKQQMQVGLQHSLTSAVHNIHNTLGMRGFFLGFGSTVMREVPFDAMQFAMWEQLKNTYKQSKLYICLYIHLCHSQRGTSGLFLSHIIHINHCTCVCIYIYIFTSY
eukprot:GHVQ01037529.1.p1 GENE.GHVQ01037529.1~~GHVQ01037529.1.p1  ORF type:complete len:201 (+),score=11.98 GHVQ01037529.1:1305-1907(+)